MTEHCFPLKHAAFFAAISLTVMSLATALTSANAMNAKLRMPGKHHQAMLIHATVAALDQANQSGNYTVLRDLAAPGFQNVNSPERLARIFSRLRNSRTNLAPAILYDPMLAQPARLDKHGFLHLVGFFPTSPMQIHFDMRYQKVGVRWRLFGISILPKRLKAEVVRPVG